MICRWHSIGLALALAVSPASAYTNGWYGWPCPTNVSYYGVETNHYFYQLYTALVERCVAVGVAGPVCVDTNTVYNGWTNNVVTTNSLTVTNPVIQYRTITTTNVYLPFSYSWSNDFGSGVSTCSPPVRRSWFVAWDSKLFAICGSFVNTNQLGTDGTYNVWFGTVTGLTTSANPPLLADTNLFRAAGIGWTNSALAHWTHSCVTSNADWLLASTHSASNSSTNWYYKSWTPLTNMHPDQILYKPRAEYVAAGTNAPTNMVVVITGSAWLGGTNWMTTNETATFTSTNPVDLSQSWRIVTNLQTYYPRANSGDAVRVTYRTLPPLYDTAIGWRLTPESLNERKACVDKLVSTYKHDASVAQTFRTTNAWSTGQSSSPANWTTAKTLSEGFWPVKPPSVGAFSRTTVGTCGWYPDYLTVNADMVNQTPWTLTNTPATSAYAYLADYYVYATAPGGSANTQQVFFADNSGLIERQFARVGSNAVATVGVAGMDQVITSASYSTNAPIPTWCDAPSGVPAITTGRGYLCSGANKSLVIYRWDGTNGGFKYK